VALCGLAAAAAGVARQLLPREFTPAQQRQIMTWEMSRRWRAMPAGWIFPAAVTYSIPGQALEASQALQLPAHRLGIAPQAGCASGVSAAGGAVLTADRCAALLRATYIDATGSMLVTVGIAVLPSSAAAARAAQLLSATGHGQDLAVHALPVAGTLAGNFRDEQRELSTAVGAGPYVVMATAGFTDGRGRVPLATDAYYDQEMTSLTFGLAETIAERIGAQPAIPSCPGAPGC
jgi:hypothetical protein